MLQHTLPKHRTVLTSSKKVTSSLPHAKTLNSDKLHLMLQDTLLKHRTALSNRLPLSKPIKLLEIISYNTTLFNNIQLF